MKYLVTGGAGFIGSNFIHYMLRTHWDIAIVCLDKLTYAADLDNLSGAEDSDRFLFVRGDICDKAAVDSLFLREKFDAVVNFAAETHVDRSISDPSPFIRSNIAGVQVLLECCTAHGVRFHQVSTDEVYGDAPLDCTYAFREEDALRPSSPYAASKAAADLLVAAYCRTYGTFATISRCTNNYGPRQYAEKLIPLAVRCAACGKSVPVYGDGSNMRDWLYVDDHCRAIDLILREGKSGMVFNVAGGNEISNLSLVKRILDILGMPHSLISFVTDRKGHDLRYPVDCGKLRALGWATQADFESCLRETVKSYIPKS